MRIRDREGHSTPIDFQGPAGKLEGLLDEPQGTPRGVAVVCHPHPLHEGTMRNTIVYRAARAIREEGGFVTLRFNFRGVEGSAGEHDGNGAEEGDAVAALELLQERYPGLPVWAAGYSFGSRTVASLATREQRIARVLLIAFPVAAYDCSFIERVRQPGYLIFGSGDSFGSASELVQRHPKLPPQLEVDEITGADHFFQGRTPLLEEHLRTYVRETIAAESGA